MMTKAPYLLYFNMFHRKSLFMIFLCRITSVTLLENELREELLRNNSKFIRPASINETVNVNFIFNVTQLLTVSEKMNLIKKKCLVGMVWQNDHMKWNPAEWGGIRDIRVSPDDIWTPDIYLLEDINDNVASGNSNFKVFIRSFSNGIQLWGVPVIYESTCAFDVSKFPYDNHICHMTFLSWNYDPKELNMTHMDANTLLPLPTAISSDWDILNSSHVRNETRQVVYIRFTYVLGRKPTKFFSNILVPSFIQMIIIIFTFILPPESGERISVSVTVLLVFAVYLEVIREQVPSGSSTTAVSKFYLAAMSGSAFSIIVTCFVLVVHFKGSEAGVTPVPKWIKFIFLDCLARCLCMKRKQSRVNDDDIILANASSNVEEHNENTISSNAQNTNEITAEVRIITSYLKEQDKQDSIEAEWQLLAKVMDKLFFAIFLFFFIISSLVILLPIVR